MQSSGAKIFAPLSALLPACTMSPSSTIQALSWASKSEVRIGFLLVSQPIFTIKVPTFSVLYGDIKILDIITLSKEVLAVNILL